MTRYSYKPCAASAIPIGVRFDVPRRGQGQIVEVAYGGLGAAEHDVGDPWRRTTDRSLPTDHADHVRYARRVSW